MQRLSSYQLRKQEEIRTGLEQRVQTPKRLQGKLAAMLTDAGSVAARSEIMR